MPHRCPYCRSNELRPASMQRTDSWTQRKLSQAYRCRKCGRRSWRIEPAIVALILAASLVLVAPVAFLGWHLVGASPEATQPVPENPVVSLTRRATQGDVAAQIELGHHHRDGEGTRVNTSEASRWYAKAAETGNREGQYLYGMALLEGNGVVQDYRSALDWLTRAAEQNHPKAQRRLGQMYADGRGTPVNYLQAYVWLSLAAAEGEEDAARLRDQALMHLPTADIEKAQATARALHTKIINSKTKAQTPPADGEPQAITPPAAASDKETPTAQ